MNAYELLGSKAIGNKTNLMHYLVTYIEENKPELMQFLEEFECLHEAQKCNEFHAETYTFLFLYVF